MSLTPTKRLWIGRIFGAAAALSGSATASAAGTINEDNYNRCRAISDEKARLLCFENLTSPQQGPSPGQAAPNNDEGKPDMTPGSISDSKAGPSSSPVGGKWRMVRTPDPRAGHERKDIISIMTTAELTNSDIDLAGVDLRCSEPDFQVLVFLLTPLRPQAQPTVTINGKKLSGGVISPGTAIQLPREASDLAREQWRALPNLSIEVENEGTKIHGIISLDGFNTALQTLVETCSSR